MYQSKRISLILLIVGLSFGTTTSSWGRETDCIDPLRESWYAKNHMTPETPIDNKYKTETCTSPTNCGSVENYTGPGDCIHRDYVSMKSFFCICKK